MSWDYCRLNHRDGFAREPIPFPEEMPGNRGHAFVIAEELLRGSIVWIDDEMPRVLSSRLSAIKRAGRRLGCDLISTYRLKKGGPVVLYKGEPLKELKKLPGEQLDFVGGLGHYA